MQLRAVWSRSQGAADDLLAAVHEYVNSLHWCLAVTCILLLSMWSSHRFSPGASAYFGEDQLEQLLQDPSIEALIIVLPVQIMLKVTGFC